MKSVSCLSQKGCSQSLGKQATSLGGGGRGRQEGRGYLVGTGGVGCHQTENPATAKQYRFTDHTLGERCQGGTQESEREAPSSYKASLAAFYWHHLISSWKQRKNAYSSTVTDQTKKKKCGLQGGRQSIDDIWRKGTLRASCHTSNVLIFHVCGGYTSVFHLCVCIFHNKMLILKT